MSRSRFFSEPVAIDAPVVRGYDFNSGIDYPALLKSMYTTGYQATSLGQAIEEINRMVRLHPLTSYAYSLHHRS